AAMTGAMRSRTSDMRLPWLGGAGSRDNRKPAPPSQQDAQATAPRHPHAKALRPCPQAVAGGSAAGPASGALRPVHHSSNRCSTVKKDGTKSTARQVEASMPLTTAMPIDLRPLAPAPSASTSGTTPRMKAKEVI